MEKILKTRRNKIQNCSSKQFSVYDKHCHASHTHCSAKHEIWQFFLCNAAAISVSSSRGTRYACNKTHGISFVRMRLVLQILYKINDKFIQISARII